jgi:flagellar hook-associated protein 3 FlgL
MRVSTAYIAQRGLNTMLEQQSRLSDIQQQISTGKRILRPSDDPSGVAQILRLNESIKVTDQYQRNADNANNRLTLEESTLESVQNSMLRIRELALQGNNSSLGLEDRKSLALEVRERLGELVGLANTRDANQEYLFAGYNVTTEPFAEAADGSYIYNGDQGQRAIQISSGRTVNDSDSGNDVFVDIKNGNGTFQINYNPANTGEVIFDLGTVIDPSAYVADTYTISFVTNINGNLAYTVYDSGPTQIIPALPLIDPDDAPDFVDGAAIQFNGIQTSLSGTPAVGDSFTVSPSVKQDVFSTVQKLITAFEGNAPGSTGDAGTFNLINQSLSEIDLAFENINSIRARIGARLNTIEDQANVNSAFKLEMQSTLSTVQDLDYTRAIIELESRLTAIEAAQASYSRIQNLSLFNFL